MFVNSSKNFLHTQNVQIMQYEWDMKALYRTISQFCWGCEQSPSQIGEKICNMTEISQNNKFRTPKIPCESLTTTSLQPKKFGRRRKPLPDISHNLKALLEIMGRSENVHFTPTRKSCRGLQNGHSFRRSRYTGVLGNGRRWQVLINFEQKKRYIGTFEDEKEAGLVHDFYSIGLNGLNAKTNFYYDEALLKEMISAYFEDGLKFNTHKFIERI